MKAPLTVDQHYFDTVITPDMHFSFCSSEDDEGRQYGCGVVFRCGPEVHIYTADPDPAHYDYERSVEIGDEASLDEVVSVLKGMLPDGAILSLGSA